MNVGTVLMTRMCHMVKHLLIRNASKMSVELDSTVVAKLENGEIKPRHHPGIIKTGTIKLPCNIKSALERIVGNYPVKKLLKDCHELERHIIKRHRPLVQQKLSDEGKVLKQRTYEWKPITYGTYEALVYAISRSAKEFGVLYNILHEIQIRDPSFQPTNFFDFGSGVGTGMWAASNFWKKSILEYYNVDNSREMNRLSELILCEGNENQQPVLTNVYYRQYLPATEIPYDLVISSHSLFELPTAEIRKDVILNLWDKCNGYLIIVEEGTRRGSELINEVRDLLLNEKGGKVFAPCPHNSACPRFSNPVDRTPCNFEVGYEPMHLGNIKSDRNTARFSYVILKRGHMLDSTCTWPRLVRETLPRSKHAICRMCTSRANLEEIVFTQSKHGRFLYRCAKVSKWGDRLPVNIS